jgi:hypothetical protein
MGGTAGGVDAVVLFVCQLEVERAQVLLQLGSSLSRAAATHPADPPPPT